MMPNITYDLLMRLPLSGWATFSVVAQVLGLFQYINIETRVSIGLVFLVHAAMLFSTIVFMSLIAAAVVIRAPGDRQTEDSSIEIDGPLEVADFQDGHDAAEFRHRPHQRPR